MGGGNGWIWSQSQCRRWDNDAGKDATSKLRRDYLGPRPCVASTSQEAFGALRLGAFGSGLTLDGCLQNWLRWAMGNKWKFRAATSTRVE